MSETADMEKKIILASASPRRRELMTFITDEFEIITADVDETIAEGTSPEDAVMQLSFKKAQAVSEKHKGRTVIGADTVVVCDGSILGKPENREHACRMLKMLSGREHSVLTGVTITDGEKTDTFFASSDVTFFDLTDEEILQYASGGEPDDKAGAYAIQGKGSLFVEKINGDYFNIVGFPVSEVNRHLKMF
ncbi:MAG: septum formation inhibitor Maf [Ruminococcaceae bacterium]|nr:septum formation inhibitor Maf [Oscillospiraceae bacterium]